MPPPTSAQAPAANPTLANLPPNILALLQSAQQQQQQQCPPTAPGQNYALPPAHFMGSPPPGATPPSAANPQYQQLMAYLQSQAAAQATSGKS